MRKVWCVLLFLLSFNCYSYHGSAYEALSACKLYSETRIQTGLGVEVDYKCTVKDHFVIANIGFAFSEGAAIRWAEQAIFYFIPDQSCSLSGKPFDLVTGMCLDSPPLIPNPARAKSCRKECCQEPSLHYPLDWASSPNIQFK